MPQAKLAREKQGRSQKEKLPWQKRAHHGQRPGEYKQDVVHRAGSQLTRRSVEFLCVCWMKRMRNEGLTPDGFLATTARRAPPHFTLPQRAFFPAIEAHARKSWPIHGHAAPHLLHEGDAFHLCVVRCGQHLSHHFVLRIR